MGSRRTLTLIAAVVLAALAAVTGYTYLSGAQKRANRGATLVEVFVFKKDVAKGTNGKDAIESKSIVADKIQSNFRPTTALTKAGLEGIKGKVALTDFPTNAVLVEGQFVDPKVAQPEASKAIPPGRVAVTIQIDSVRGVAGNIVPGDKVDMLLLIGCPALLPCPHGKIPPVDLFEEDKGVRMLYQNVEILFIGTTVAPQPGAATAAVNPGSGLITFSVPVLAAERIVHASQNAGGGGSSIYLLGIPSDNIPVDVAPINIGANATTPFPPAGVLDPYNKDDK